MTSHFIIEISDPFVVYEMVRQAADHRDTDTYDRWHIEMLYICQKRGIETFDEASKSGYVVRFIDGTEEYFEKLCDRVNDNTSFYFHHGGVSKRHNGLKDTPDYIVLEGLRTGKYDVEAWEMSYDKDLIAMRLDMLIKRPGCDAVVYPFYDTDCFDTFVGLQSWLSDQLEDDPVSKKSILAELDGTV